MGRKRAKGDKWRRITRSRHRVRTPRLRFYARRPRRRRHGNASRDHAAVHPRRHVRESSIGRATRTAIGGTGRPTETAKHVEWNESSEREKRETSDPSGARAGRGGGGSAACGATRRDATRRDARARVPAAGRAREAWFGLFSGLFFSLVSHIRRVPQYIIHTSHGHLHSCARGARASDLQSSSPSPR